LSEDELFRLVERLVETDEALAEIVGNIDAVLLPEGQSYLLRAAQRALVESEARAKAQASFLEALIASLPDVVEYIDLDHRVLFANRVLPEYGRNDVVGADWLSLVPELVRAELAGILAAVASQGQTAVHESAVEGTTGGQGWVARRFGPVRRGDRVVGIVILTRDITAKRSAEAQLMAVDRMMAVGTLAAGVAHEINNPLAAVVMNLDLLADQVASLPDQREVPDDLHALVNESRHAAERVRLIVRDLKVFSRSEEDVRTTVDVEHVLDSTLRMARNEIRHRARVIRQYSGVPRVEGNEGRLGQVFLNLIMNAAQAIPEGNASAQTIRVSTDLDAQGRVRVSVADDGTGIPFEIQPRLFTPFFTTKPVGFGVGLGLAICQRIVTSLGGQIDFESTPRVGTTFRVVLPVARRAHRAGPTTSPPTGARRRGRVLVIDDDASVTTTLFRALSLDHDVLAVDSGTRALELFDQGERYDVIVCDLMMPEMTGMQLYEELKERDPAEAARIVFMTGGAFTAAAREFFETVNNPRIEKPFSARELRELINQLLQ
jgi:PAS domain S-box-containing protein